MKKLIAILLLALLLFNLAGYRLFFEYLQQQHKTSLEAGLNNNEYDYSDLFEIRIPLSLPYLAVQNDFERVDGEMTVDGKLYKYVKRKIVNGQLILLCLADDQQTIIDHAKNEFGSQVNGVPSSHKKNTELPKKIVVASEYEEVTKQSPIVISSLCQRAKIHYAAAALSAVFLEFADNPPESRLSYYVFEQGNSGSTIDADEIKKALNL